MKFGEASGWNQDDVFRFEVYPRTNPPTRHVIVSILYSTIGLDFVKELILGDAEGLLAFQAEQLLLGRTVDA